MPLNPETYAVPTLALLCALVAVFSALCFQGRHYPSESRRPDEPPAIPHRHLLWLTGWTIGVLRLALQIWVPRPTGFPLFVARASMQLAPLMFLGSLAPQYLTRRPRILYVAAFGLPLIVFAAVISFEPHPGGFARGLLIACALFGLYVAGRWSLIRNLLPEWLSLAIVAGLGGGCIWLALKQEYAIVLILVHSGVLLMAALLFAAQFRRFTAGVVFTVGGLALWAIPGMLHPMLSTGPLAPGWLRVLNLLKIITAVGMVVLVLEDQIAANRAGQERDRRARAELEKYSGLCFTNVPAGENREEYDSICEAIATLSRFGQAAIFLLGPDHNFMLVGRAGLDGALEGALDAMARRTTQQKIQEVSAGPWFSREVGNLTHMDLSGLMQPGDELNLMQFRMAHVMGIRTRDGRLLGVLMLAGMRNPAEPLQTEDVLPLELLVARLGAACEQRELLRRLMQSERLAGLGQLAGGVAHELNNPLTAVFGFAELLEESEEATTRERAGVILNEARRMKQIVDGLRRFCRATSGERRLVPPDLMLRDLERLHQGECEKSGIRLEVRIPDDLPAIRIDGEQIRQVFLQLAENAIHSLEQLAPDRERRLTIEAARIPHAVQVVFRDSGAGFADPARAFDPYFTTRHPGEGAGLGLSICYSIVREHGGEISALNLHPHGSAVVIELPTALSEESYSGTSVPGSVTGDDRMAREI